MAYLTLLGIIVSCGVTLIAAVIQILPDILPTSLPVFQTDGAKTVVVEAPIPTLIVENTVFSTEPIAFSTEPIAPASPASSTSTVGASSSLTTGAAPTTATDAPTPTHTLEPLPAIILFPEPQSFTIYVASDQPISLTELELLVTIEGALRTIHPAEDFDILQLLAGEAQTGACFRYLSPGASVPLPSECADRQNVFDRQVARPDVFWHDAATGTIRTLLVRWGKVTASCATARCPIQPLEGS